ncbi:MFS transporter [Stackebrandtia soli]|uniref:MFS transporter n=1 Tax=Stackebrandtia soli TaxID=1892856 RepID=UPI0039E97AB1
MVEASIDREHPVSGDPPTEPPLWRNRSFVLLWASRTISVIGTALGPMALSFGVLALPSAGIGELSWVLACQAVPQVLLILVGGVIADRFSRVTTMIVAELVAAGAWGGLAVVVTMNDAPLWMLCGLAATTGIAGAMFVPAYDGVVPEAIAAAQRQAANGYLRLGLNVARLSGYAIGGGVIVLVGPAAALAANAVSYVVSAALVAFIRLPRRARTGAPNVWGQLAEGAREFFSRQWLWAVTAQFSVVIAATSAYAGVLGPALLSEGVFGAPAWAAIVSAQALGTISGTVVAIRVRPRYPIRVAAVAVLGLAMPMATLGVGLPLVVTVVAAFLSGVAMDVFAVLWRTSVQRLVPLGAQSRVSSWDMLGSLILAPIGLAVAGPLAAVVGVDVALLGCAVLITVATVAVLASPEVRRLRSDDGRAT